MAIGATVATIAAGRLAARRSSDLGCAMSPSAYLHIRRIYVRKERLYDRDGTMPLGWQAEYVRMAR